MLTQRYFQNQCYRVNQILLEKNQVSKSVRNQEKVLQSWFPKWKKH